MKKFLSLSLLMAMMVSLSLLARAQDEKNNDNGNTKSESKNENVTIPEGTMAKVSLQTRLSSKINEVGDEVIGVLYEPVRGSDGRIAIPRGAEFAGRVTQVQAAKKPQKEATMTVIFETMHMPYGSEKIATTILAIDDYANDQKLRSKDDEGKVGGGHSGGRTARNAGIGGGIGTLGGIVLGRGGAGIGAVAGAIGVGAGTGVLMTKGNDIKLEPGTIFRIRFDREISLPVSESSQ
ncbi:MAG: hypothetical protein J2P41_13355 [Blastocatellia bacterium]|nr:hypothetical protein [Blastocatellia bacterium]